MRKQVVRVGTVVLLSLGVAIAARDGPASAQTIGPAKRVGILSGFGCGPGPLAHRLAELGWIGGRTLIIDCVSTAGASSDQLALLASDLITRRPDVLVASPTHYVRALKQATTTIPIIMMATPNPVQNGLVTNLPRPEANVTGVAQSGIDLVGKRIEMLKEILPRLSRLAIIFSRGGDPIYQEQLEKNATAAAMRLGLTWQAVRPAVPDDFDAMFARLKAEAFDAVYVAPGPLSYANQPRIAELAQRHGLPTIGDLPIYAKNGILLTYGEEPRRNVMRAAEYVDRILRGAKPGDLPVEEPAKFELVMNLKTAKALGLTIPPLLLARADEVIE